MAGGVVSADQRCLRCAALWPAWAGVGSGPWGSLRCQASDSSWNPLPCALSRWKRNLNQVLTNPSNLKRDPATPSLFGKFWGLFPLYSICPLKLRCFFILFCFLCPWSDESSRSLSVLSLPTAVCHVEGGVSLPHPILFSLPFSVAFCHIEAIQSLLQGEFFYK